MAATPSADDSLSNQPVLLRSEADGIATLTLNRPAARNSLSSELMSELAAALEAIAAERSIRVVVLAAQGPAFCAGHDMKELLANRNAAYYQATFRRSSQIMQAIVHLPQPVIAKVHGVATAAGCQLVASCDLAVAADEVRFATPGVNIGLFCSTPMVALGRNVSRKRAMEMLLTGEAIDAATAADFGLINRAVPPSELDREVMELAAKIAAKSSLTVAMGKGAFYRQLDLDLGRAYDYAAEVMARNMLARDAQEGLAAFLEKREPEWQDC